MQTGPQTDVAVHPSHAGAHAASSKADVGSLRESVNIPFHVSRMLRAAGLCVSTTWLKAALRMPERLANGKGTLRVLEAQPALAVQPRMLRWLTPPFIEVRTLLGIQHLRPEWNL